MNQRTVLLTPLLVLALLATALAAGIAPDTSEAQSDAWVVDQADGMTVVYDDGTRLEIQLGTDPGAGMYSVIISGESFYKRLEAAHQDVLVEMGETLQKDKVYLIVATGAGWSAQCTLRNVDVFDIAITVTPEGAGTVTGAGPYNTGSQVTLEAVPAEDYNFDGWYSGYTKVSADTTYTFTAETDAAFVANFVAKQPAVTEYEITFLDEYLKVYSGVMELQSGSKVASGTVLTVSAVREGYVAKITAGDAEITEGIFELVSDTFIRVSWNAEEKVTENPDGTVTTETGSETTTAEGTVIVENTTTVVDEDKGITTTVTEKTETNADKGTSVVENTTVVVDDSKGTTTTTTEKTETGEDRTVIVENTTTVVDDNKGTTTTVTEKTETNADKGTSVVENTTVVVDDSKGITTSKTEKTETEGDKVSTTVEEAMGFTPSAIESESSSVGSLTVEVGTTTIEFDKESVTQFKGNDLAVSTISGLEVTEMGSVSEKVEAGATVISFNVNSGDSKVHELGGKAKVTVTAEPGMDISKVVIWHIDDNGNIIERIYDFEYDPVTGIITFETTAFSAFVIGEKVPEPNGDTVMTLAAILAVTVVFIFGMMFAIRRAGAQ